MCQRFHHSIRLSRVSKLICMFQGARKYYEAQVLHVLCFGYLLLFRRKTDFCSITQQTVNICKPHRSSIEHTDLVTEMLKNNETWHVEKV